MKGVLLFRFSKLHSGGCSRVHFTVSVERNERAGQLLIVVPLSLITALDDITCPKRPHKQPRLSQCVAILYRQMPNNRARRISEGPYQRTTNAFTCTSHRSTARHPAPLSAVTSRPHTSTTFGKAIAAYALLGPGIKVSKKSTALSKQIHT